MTTPKERAEIKAREIVDAGDLIPDCSIYDPEWDMAVKKQIKLIAEALLEFSQGSTVGDEMECLLHELIGHFLATPESKLACEYVERIRAALSKDSAKREGEK